jgi:hypothetical protein
MGCDLLLDGFVVPEGGFDIEGAVALVPTLSAEDLAGWAEERLGEEAGGTVEVLREVLVDDLRVLADEGREHGVYRFARGRGEVGIWLSGGGSWGESPTEEFDQVRALHWLPQAVLDKLLRVDHEEAEAAGDRARLQAERDFLVGWATEGSQGRSGRALVRAVLTGESPAESLVPDDDADLQRCERTVSQLPEHLRRSGEAVLTHFREVRRRERTAA